MSDFSMSQFSRNEITIKTLEVNINEREYEIRRARIYIDSSRRCILKCGLPTTEKATETFLKLDCEENLLKTTELSLEPLKQRVEQLKYLQQHQIDKAG